MIDIETLDTKNTAVVLSIGAVQFEPKTGNILKSFYKVLRLQDQAKRSISTSTVKWWVDQIKNGALTDQFNGDVPVRNALIFLRDFIQDTLETADERLEIWACDPDFDCEILENLYAEYGLLTPWRYSDKRSVRTVRSLAKLWGFLPPKIEATHNALEDCERQVLEVSGVIEFIDKVLCDVKTNAPIA